MSKSPKKKPAEKSGVIVALNPAPKAAEAGHPGAKAGAKSAQGKKR